jgi:fructose-1,6-bisphosphatase II
MHGRASALAHRLALVTEAAASAVHPLLGCGDNHAIDGVAVAAMRRALRHCPTAAVVACEGEKDAAPRLLRGEIVGAPGAPAAAGCDNRRAPPTASGAQLDLAIDPVDGTRAAADDAPGALAALAAVPRGRMFDPTGLAYMSRLAAGPLAGCHLALDAPLEQTLQRAAAALGKPLAALTVAVLQRPRHELLIAAVRRSGARLHLLAHADLAATIAVAVPGSGIDLAIGIAGAPETILAACALRCLGGQLQARPWPRDERDRALLRGAGIDPGRVLEASDLAGSDDVAFAASGITGSDLLPGAGSDAGGCAVVSLLASTGAAPLWRQVVLPSTPPRRPRRSSLP